MEDDAQHSGLDDLVMLSIGVIAGWLLFFGRGKPVKMPAKLPNLTKTLNGAVWSNIAAVTLQSTSIAPSVKRGATIQDLSDLQDQLDQSASDAHASLIHDPRASTDPSYVRKAVEVNNVANQIDILLAAKIVSLVGEDITAVKRQADRASNEARAIPNAGNKIVQADSFISALNGVISFFAG